MPGEERSKLWEKCNLGKVEEVRKALEEGAEPNTTDGEREITCLMVAIFFCPKTATFAKSANL